MDEAYDFSGMTVETIDEEPEHAGGKRRKYDVNPFEKFMAVCIKSGKGQAVTLPTKAVKDAINLIRQAADDQGKAARITLHTRAGRVNAKEVDGLSPQTKVTIKFWAVPKRTNKPRANAAPVTAETLAADTPAQ